MVNNKSQLVRTLISCAFILTPFQSIAVDKYWICDSDSWDRNSCWGPAGQPTSYDDVFLTQSDDIDRVVTYVNPFNPGDPEDAFLPDIRNLTIDATGSGTMTLSQAQDRLGHIEGDFGNLIVGLDGVGIFNQFGGSNQPYFAFLGANSAGSGTYNLSDSGNFYTRYLYLGYKASFSPLVESGGIGMFNQSGGTAFIDGNLHISSNSTYNLSGGELEFDGNAGYTIQGKFNQSGGTVFLVGGEYEGVDRAIMNGEYNLSGGNYTVWAYDTILGTFNQSGGVKDTGTMNIGGTYNLTGGHLETNDVVVNTGGKFNFDGGTLATDHFINDGTLTLGDASSGTIIVGDYKQLLDGTLDIDIALSMYGFDNDLLEITGIAELGGTLDVDLDFNFGTDLMSGIQQFGLDSQYLYFDILTAETIIGEFDFLDLPPLTPSPLLRWDISYIYDDFGTDYVRLMIIAAPEPPIAILICSGLIGFIVIARRKKV